MHRIGCEQLCSAPNATAARASCRPETEGLLEVLGRVAFPDWTFASPGAELGGRVLALYVALYEHGLMEVCVCVCVCVCRWGVGV